MRQRLLARLACVLSLAALMGQAAVAQAQSRLEQSVVRLAVSKRAVDPSAPWQYEDVQQQAHLGVVIEGGQILTSAFAVADASFIEGQLFGRANKTELSVSFVDYEANLALLAPGDKGGLEGTRPVTLGDDLAVNDTVDIYKARDAYQLARMPASLQDVGIFGTVTSAYSQATYLLKAQQTGLGWSEPVFRDDRLVALVTGQDANYVYATPLSLIRHFLDDKHDDGYRGFPSIGVELAPLTSPDTRRLLKAEGRAGVRIASVNAAGAFAALLRPDDVLLEIDGVEISEHGFFTHPKWGKVPLKYLVNQRYGGDTLKLKILRAGEAMDIEAKLDRFDSNRFPVVAYRYGAPEPHLIFGGFIFQELSRAYLKQWGREWEDMAPIDLLYVYNFQDELAADPSKRIIFVSRVLADEFNRGYGAIQQQIVTAVNGQPVASMASLRAALSKPISRNGKSYARITFARDGGEAILGYEGLAAAHARMARTYEIESPESFFKAP